jgi:predicted transcriptional regulator
MKAARVLRYARRRAGLSQRELSRKSGVPQSTIGRIESGAVDPRASTVNRLIRACGFDLEVEPLLGQGVDRSQIEECLAVTPAERVERAGREALIFEMLGTARTSR